nr:golgin subfamily B member 1 isoform X1 [Crassostrea gigas]
MDETSARPTHQSNEEIQKFIDMAENHRFFEDVEDIDGKELRAKLSQLNQEKIQIKKAFSVQTISKDMFFKYLCQDIQSWPTQKESEDQQMQEVTQRLKNCKESIDQEKTTAEELAACAEESYEMLKTKISELKEIVLKREQKKKELEELKKKANVANVSIPTNLKEAIQSQREATERVESETAKHQVSLTEAKTNQHRLHEELAAVKDKLNKREDSKQKSQTITAKRAAVLKENIKENTELLNYIKTLSGLRELPVEDPDSIRLEFIPEGEEDASLNLTMHFAVDLSGRVHLTGAEVQTFNTNRFYVNIESLPMDDLIRTAVEKNDPVLLICNLRERWASYQPIVSEIKKLSERHAVDWIQEEGVVRVLLGKRGTVICTLSVPKTYPQEGSVSLVSVHGGYGDDNTMDVDEPAAEKKSLQQWVDYLEEKYAKS